MLGQSSRRRGVVGARYHYSLAVVRLVMGVVGLHIVVDRPGALDFNQPPARIIFVGNRFGCPSGTAGKQCDGGSQVQDVFHTPLPSWIKF